MAFTLHQQANGSLRLLDKASSRPRLSRFPLFYKQAIGKDVDVAAEATGASHPRVQRRAGVTASQPRRHRPTSPQPQSPPSAQHQADSKPQNLSNSLMEADRHPAHDGDEGDSILTPTSTLPAAGPKEVKRRGRKVAGPDAIAAPRDVSTAANASGTAAASAGPSPFSGSQPDGAHTGPNAASLSQKRKARYGRPPVHAATPGQDPGPRSKMSTASQLPETAAGSGSSCGTGADTSIGTGLKRQSRSKATPAAAAAPNQPEASSTVLEGRQQSQLQQQHQLQDGIRPRRGLAVGSAPLDGAALAGDPGDARSPKPGRAPSRTGVPLAAADVRPRHRQALGRQPGDDGPPAHGPVAQRRPTPISVLQQWGLRTPAHRRDSSGSGGDVASIIAVLTSPPARAVAAAARSLSVDFTVIHAGTADAHILGDAASRATAAAAAAATAAAPPQDPAIHASRGQAVSSTTPMAVEPTTVRIGSPRSGADNPANTPESPASTSEIAHSGQGVIWPLLPDGLRTLARCRKDPSNSSGKRSSRNGSNGSNGSDGSNGSNQPSRGARQLAASRSDAADPDEWGETAILEAVTTVLEAVSCAILERGMYPTRHAATKLRSAVQSGLRWAHKARGSGAPPPEAQSSGTTTANEPALLRIWEALRIPHEVPNTAAEVLVRQAPYLTGCQVAAALAAVGALAQPLDERASTALADRALELLAEGMPRLDGEGEDGEEGEHEGGDNGSVAEDEANSFTYAGHGRSGSDREARGGAATGGARGGLNRLEGAGRYYNGTGGDDAGEEVRGRGAEPLVPPLAALLMLLLATVLPRVLSRRKVRWVMWGQLKAITLQPPGPATAADGDGDNGSAPPPLSPLRHQTEIGQRPARCHTPDGTDDGAIEAAGKGGQDEVDGGGLGVPGGRGPRPEAGGQVPLSAVGALLITADRLQVFLPGSQVEDRALHRLLTGGNKAGGLPPRQLVTVLRSLTDQQVLLCSDVLWRLMARLSGAARSGYITPAEAVTVLGCLSAQLYGISRKELSGLTRNIFKAIEEYAQAEETVANSHAGPTAGKQMPYSLPYLASLCGEIEVHLGQLPSLSWSHPDKVVAVREALAGFAASGGAHPQAVHLAWRDFVRGPNSSLGRQRANEPAADDYIEAARRELLSSSDLGESVLEHVLLLEPGAGPAAAGGWGSRPRVKA